MNNNRSFKLLMLLIIVAIASFGGYYQLVGIHNTVPTEKERMEAKIMLDHLVQTSFLGATEIDQSNKNLTVIVNPHKWNDISFKQKELMLVSFWQANALSSKKPWVEIKDKNTGKILGKFRPNNGLILEY